MQDEPDLPIDEAPPDPSLLADLRDLIVIISGATVVISVLVAIIAPSTIGGAGMIGGAALCVFHGAHRSYANWCPHCGHDTRPFSTACGHCGGMYQEPQR